MERFRFWQWLSFNLPKELLYFCAIKVLAEVSGMEKYSGTVVDKIPFMDGIKEFEMKYKIE